MPSIGVPEQLLESAAFRTERGAFIVEIALRRCARYPMTRLTWW